MSTLLPAPLAFPSRVGEQDGPGGLDPPGGAPGGGDAAGTAFAQSPAGVLHPHAGPSKEDTALDVADLHRDALRLYEDGDPAAAAERLERFVQLRPGAAEALSDLGTLYFALGLPLPAGRCLVRALELQPDFEDAGFNLAQVLRATGLNRAALDAAPADLPGYCAALAADEATRPLGEALAGVAAAVRATTFGQAGPGEADWTDRIERMRAELEASTDVTDRWGREATIGEITRSASKKPLWASLLFRLVRHLRPASCIEMGTCVGISGAYQAAALALNGAGRLVTLEGHEALVAVARGTFAQLGLTQAEVRAGRFEDTLEPALDDMDPVDYLFIDGHHQEDATLAYFEQALPHLSRCATLVFDDITWSEGMQRAWARLQEDERVTVSVDLRSIGLCLLSRVPAPRRRYSFDIGAARRSRTEQRSAAG